MANTFNLGNGNWAQKTEKLLAYNAENDNYKPLPFDFDRGSTATRVNRDGLIETVGVDEPRIDFLNNTKGHLLLEPQRRNLVINSENFAGSGWNNFASITPIANSTISPEGVQNASTLECSGNNVFRYSFTASSSTNYVGSVFVKAKETTNDFGIQTLESGTPHVSVFNIESGVVVTQASNHIASIKDYGNGWFRCSVKFNSGSSTSNIFDFKGSQTTDNKEFYAWGAQIEEGSYATSYIPTSGQSGGVTRSADGDLIQSVENVISNSDTYSFLGDFYLPKGTQSGGGEILFENTSGSSQSRIYLNLGSFIRFRTDYPATNYDITYSTLGLEGGDLVKIGLSVNNGVMKVFVNGVLRNTFGAATIDFKRIHMRAITEVLLKKYFLYNTALSDSELQALTS